jgi:hypothetical protein
MLAVIRDAASADPEIASLWARIQSVFRENQRPILQSIADRAALGPGLDVNTGADILWALNHPTLHALLTSERGWSPQRYEQWLGDLLCAHLLRAPNQHKQPKTRVPDRPPKPPIETRQARAETDQWASFSPCEPSRVVCLAVRRPRRDVLQFHECGRARPGALRLIRSPAYFEIGSAPAGPPGPAMRGYRDTWRDAAAARFGADSRAPPLLLIDHPETEE